MKYVCLQVVEQSQANNDHYDFDGIQYQVDNFHLEEIFFIVIMGMYHIEECNCCNNSSTHRIDSVENQWVFSSFVLTKFIFT